MDLETNEPGATHSPRIHSRSTGLLHGWIASIKEFWRLLIGTRAAESEISKKSPIIRLVILLLISFKLGLLGFILTTGWHPNLNVYNIKHESFIDIPGWYMLIRSQFPKEYPKDYNKYWDQVKNDVVICVKTGKEVQQQRVVKAKATWMDGRHIPHLLVVSDIEQEVWYGQKSIDLKKTLPTILNASHPDGESERDIRLRSKLLSGGWAGDSGKNLPALALMYEKCPTCKAYFMVDDDTYVLLENLAFNLLDESGGNIHALWRMAFDQPVYGGRYFRVSSCYIYNDDGQDAFGNWAPTFAHGGAGILINNRALSLMVPHIGACMKQFSAKCYAGDMQVALCVSMYGGMKDGSVDIHQFQGDHLSWLITELNKNNDTELHKVWNGRDRIVTLHQLPEPEQALMHEFEMSWVGNQSFRDLKRFAYEHNVTTRRPRRAWVPTRRGKKTTWSTEDVMD